MAFCLIRWPASADVVQVHHESERLEDLENDLNQNNQILHGIHADLVYSHADMTLSDTSGRHLWKFEKKTA